MSMHMPLLLKLFLTSGLFAIGVCIVGGLTVGNPIVQKFCWTAVIGVGVAWLIGAMVVIWTIA